MIRDRGKNLVYNCLSVPNIFEIFPKKYYVKKIYRKNAKYGNICSSQMRCFFDIMGRKAKMWRGTKGERII